MPPDPKLPPSGDVPPTLVPSHPPVITNPPQTSVSGHSGLPHLFSNLLSLCLGLFLADAFLSFLDESLGLFFGFHGLKGIRGLSFLAMLLAAVMLYVLM